MFSIVKLEDIIKLDPKQFNNITESVKQNLVSNYENKVIGKLDSFVIKIVDIDEHTIINGKVNEVTGGVNYLVRYTAVLFNPVKNGILDVVIYKSNEIGLFGKVKLINNGDNVNIQCIMPKELLTNHTFSITDQCWHNGTDNVKVDSNIKMKIKDVTMDYYRIVIIGEI